ncbi:MAG: hypothetical protein K2L82_11710 [Lachnospiraceae bacterium]|nr:hypothetical protein [Lachnospiraceae bacterium]
MGHGDKKVYPAAMMAAAMIILVTGCSKAQETSELPGGAYISEESTGDDAEDMAKETNLPTDEEQIGEIGGRRLTEAELQEYTEWVQEKSNYGFLLSDWEDPAQINLFEVFYGGAGISHAGTEEQIQAFLNRYGQEELYTDFLVMDKADMNVFLAEKVGLSYDELLAKGNNSIEGIYYPETDSFCIEAGDTNYCMFTCTDGVLNEDGTIVTLDFEGDYWVSKCEVKVNIIGDTKVIVSNHILEGSILDEMNEPIEEPACLIDENVLNNPHFDADASAVESGYVLGDWSKITKDALQGTWYHHPKSEGENKRYDVALKFDGDNAVVYYPAQDFYGEVCYEWDVIDRSGRGLCPELDIYFRGTKDAPLVWYILGISDDKEYFWCNGEVFYKQ